MEESPDPREQTVGPELNELIAECIDKMAVDGQSAVEKICQQYPEHASSIRSRIATLQRAGLLESPDSFTIPEKLGEFRLLRVLGGGGMGVVYLAEQEGLGRRVALKMIRPDQVLFDTARERFQREAAVLASLQHSGIVPIHTFGEDQGIPYFAMEYVEGRTLGSVLRKFRGRQPEELTGADLLAALGEGVEADASSAELRFDPEGSWHEACLRLALQAARALNYAHGEGVLHRDVKPSNLLVRPNGRLLLFDFGLARSESTSRLTRTGAFLGSLPFMSPEQLRGDDLDARSDLYSLGVTLYEMLTLRLPYHENKAEATRGRILRGELRMPREFNSELPWDLETVCVTAMDVEPARRYATAAELAEDLDHVLHLRPISARRPGARIRMQRWVQRHPALAVAVLLGSLIVLGGPAVYAVLQKRSNQRIEAKNVELQAAMEDLHRSLELTLDTVDVALREVADEHLRNVPGMARVRDVLLTKALENFDAMAELRPDDPRMSLMRARLLNAQGLVLDDLGQMREAVAAFEEGIETLERLRFERGQDPVADLLQTKLLSNSAMVYGKMGEIELEEDRELDTILFLEELCEQFPEAADFAYGLALSRQNFFWRTHARGDFEEALRQAEFVLEDAEIAVDLEPGRDACHVALSQAYGCRAAAYRGVGDRDKAMVDFRESYERLDHMLQTRSGDSAWYYVFVRLAQNYGLTAMELGDLVTARSVLDRGREVADKLIKFYPFVIDFELQQARLDNAFGLLLARSGEAGAEDSYRRALKLLRELIERHSNHQEVREELGLTLNNLASACLDRGDLEEAGFVADDAFAVNQALLDDCPQLKSAYGQTVTSHLAQTLVSLALEDPATAADWLRDVPRPDELTLKHQRDVTFLWADVCRIARDHQGVEAMSDYVEEAMRWIRGALEAQLLSAEDLRRWTNFQALQDQPAFEELISAHPD